MPEISEREKEFEERVKEAGSWITDDFLRDLLVEYEKNDQIKIVEKIILPAVGLGNNYLSILHRVAVKFYQNGSGEKEKNLIIKQFPRAKLAQKFLKDLGFFVKEEMMYTDILPKMNDIQNECIDDLFIAPVSYPNKLENVIIMEDLKVQGYKIMDRREQLPFEYLVQALKSIARIQVLSLVFEKKYPELFSQITTEYYSEKSREHFGPFFDQAFSVISKQLAEYPEGAKYSDITERFGSKGFDVVKKNFEIASKGFLQVLCHGDMWTTNIMFKEDENGDPVHAKLVDFQLCRISSPAIDVLHLMFTSAQPRVLSERWFDLMEKYYESFQENLKLFGFEETFFTLEEFHQELKRLSPYAFMLYNIMLPSFLSATDDVIDMESIDEDTMEIPDDGDYIKKIFRNEKTRNVMIGAAAHCDKLGFLEVIEKALKYVPDKSKI